MNPETGSISPANPDHNICAHAHCDDASSRNGRGFCKDMTATLPEILAEFNGSMRKATRHLTPAPGPTVSTESVVISPAT